MNIQDIIIKSYGCLFNRKFIPSRFFSPMRYFLRILSKRFMPFYLNKKRNVVNQHTCEKKIVVSLTSFPARINTVWMVVECLLRQTLKPYKIILWLSKDQFHSEKSIPASLKSRISELFEIRFVDDDFRSHKKYLYAFKEFENDIVITVDDDIFYPTTMVEKLYEKHLENPTSVICRYGKVVERNANGLARYSQWNEYFSLKEKNVFFGSGGGTLFVPSLLFSDVLKIEIAMKLCPLADDVWLNAMTRINNIPVVPITRDLILPVFNGSDECLCSKNVGESLNDAQINNINSFYGEIF